MVIQNKLSRGKNSLVFVNSYNKTEKGFAHLLLIVFFLILFFVILYSVFKGKNKTDEIARTTSQTTFASDNTINIEEDLDNTDLELESLEGDLESLDADVLTL